MVRKALWSAVIALVSLSLFVIGVMAQDDLTQSNETTPAVSVVPQIAAANVVQTVPVTLTLSIPGPTGPVTIEVPIFLSLNIRIGISPEMTTTLEVTPSVSTGGGAPPRVTIVSQGGDTGENTSESTPESPAGNDEESTPESTPESVEATPTEAATSTPTSEPPTAQPPTATPQPTEASTEPTIEPTSEAVATEVALPTATPTPAATAAPEVVAPACSDPRAIIVSPGVGQVVSAEVNVLGTATHENFGYYKVEYAQGENIGPDGAYAYLGGGKTPVTGGLLTSFDSTTIDNGPYTLKLTVVDSVGNFPPPCTVSIVVEN